MIADGTTEDVAASEDGTSSATVNLDHSNYATVTLTGAGTPTVTPAGSGTNQTALPLFVNAGTGDFHQATGSPTIDAGAVDGSSGTLDFDGDPRTLDGDCSGGAAPDIGVAELSVSCLPPDPPAPDPGAGGATDTEPPNTTITAGPKAKTKSKTASFSFTSTEPGSTFECSVDDQAPKAFGPCTSPLAVKVKKGKHTFSVRAKDAAGNVDPTPATQDWKVKKKRKK